MDIAEFGVIYYMRNNFVGERYGKIIIISRNGSNANYVCDCGKNKNAKMADIRRGRIVSCGCLKKTKEWRGRTIEMQKKGILNIGGDHYDKILRPFKYLMKSIKNQGRKFDEDLSLFDIKEVWEKQNGLCAYTGIKLI